jgi:hypothetical protein
MPVVIGRDSNPPIGPQKKCGHSKLSRTVVSRPFIARHDMHIAVQDIARKQMQAAWSSKPKIDVYLNLHAPKIAIPIKHAICSNSKQGAVTLLADLGSLIISSNHVEYGILTPEEAALYDCYALVSSDLSVHLINGNFRWPEPGRRPLDAQSDAFHYATPAGLSRPSPVPASTKSVPRHEASEYLGENAAAVRVLDHCSTSASVHMAHVSHPTLPLVRIGLQVSSCLPEHACRFS